jgi:hypothetical protein
MALDRDSQSVQFVELYALYRASLSVCEYHGPSDKLRASLFESPDCIFFQGVASATRRCLMG